MRTVVLSVCMLAAACGAPSSNSPTSPLGSGIAPAGTQAQGGAQLPFSASFTRSSSGAVNCPPTCPPTILRITGQQEGTATLLGRFTAESLSVVDLTNGGATITWDFTAANGDRLFTTAVGLEEAGPPNDHRVTLGGTVVGGTGRFAAATGTFTIRIVETIDLVTNTATGSGTIEGHINLNK